jgi:hypothetical protein
MCEAAERNTRAIFEIEMMAGNWVFDLATLKQILTGTDCQHEDPQGSSST